MSSKSKKLSQYPVHLGTGAKAISQPEFTGEMSWYEAYGQRIEADGKEGRLVSFHSFEKPWDIWEMHPEGDEVVVCIEGSCTLIQEVDGAPNAITLGPGEYAINPKGTWHTADVKTKASVFFITAGKGTQHRKR